jgi:diamine N-acetyltransferase
MMLQKDHIVLRVPEPADLKWMATIENNPDYWTVGDTMAPFSEYALKKFIADSQDVIKNRQIRFVVECDQQPAGLIDLFDWHPLHERAAVGVLVLPEFRGHGVAHQALALAEQYAVQKWLVRNLYASVHSGNTASVKLFEKAGFEKIGERKNWYRIPVGWENEILYVKVVSNG